ncbi:MAG TPA: polysaccharide deacetylase family protein, partial [Pseudonocardiaceae bacterium]|nr:polysaccharide deacetylase family protein [Pseudonocardiaceae bacterium]
RDWSRPGVAQIVTRVRHQVQPGAVILLHDGGGRRDQTIAALAQLLPWFVTQGYQLDVPGP